MSTLALVQLELYAPQAAQLAALASIAARLDRAVLRTLRLAMLPTVDATAESDLWFSAVVARRSASEIVLHTDLLASLRSKLVESGRLAAARAALVAMRVGAPPFLALEEELIFLGLCDGTEANIERLLGKAIATLRLQKDRAPDVAGWALRALPRLPETVRRTAAAWSLAFGAEIELGYTVSFDGLPPAGAISIDERVPSVALRVGRRENSLLLGVADGPELSVPATTPRVVTVETEGRRIVAAIDPGQVHSVTVEPGDVVITNLLGERWRASSLAPEQQPEIEQAPENGFWILVHGTEEYTLPARHYKLALALGESLARGGFSLITLGRKGVSHVIAKAFWGALQRQGFSSAVCRLLHLVAAASAADFREAGRTLFPAADQTSAAAALARADAVLLIGHSSEDQGLTAAALRAGVRVGLLERGFEQQDDLELQSLGELDSLSPPEVALAVTDSLRRRIPTEATRISQVSAHLLHLAALALDERELDNYNKRLRAIQNVLPEAVAVSLASDPRRPSFRLLGYLNAGRSIPGDVLLSALRTEQRTVQAFWETRTLWFALEALSHFRLAEEEQPSRALAAACAAIELDLQANPLIDPEGQCKELLRKVAHRSKWSMRAAELARLGFEYVELRATMPVGDARTARMTEIVDSISWHSALPQAQEAEVWFKSGSAGQRIVALSLLLGAREPDGCALVEEAIAQPYSPFEQYTALRVAAELLGGIDRDRLSSLRKVLEEQRSGPPGIIDATDPSRWWLSLSLLQQITEKLAALQSVEHRPGEPANVSAPLTSGVRAVSGSSGIHRISPTDSAASSDANPVRAELGAQFYMAGTEDSGEYLVLIVTELGRIGYRDLRDGRYRVRIEPVDEDATALLRPFFPTSQGWKQPGDGGQFRYSTVVDTTDDLRTTVLEAIPALLSAGPQVDVNAQAPDWARELVAQAQEAKQSSTIPASESADVAILVWQLEGLAGIVRREAWESIRSSDTGPLAKSYFRKTTRQGLRVLLAHQAGLGPISGAILAREVIDAYQPRLMLIVGAVGGFADRGVRPGDVIVSEQIVDYEQEERMSPRPKAGLALYNCDKILVSAMRSFAAEEWKPRATLPRPSGDAPDTPRVHFGTILSGNNVLKEPWAFDIRRSVDEAIGVEMEASGAAAVAARRGGSLRLAMIGGVVDSADATKDDAWHGYAMDVAASFVSSFIERIRTDFSLSSSAKPADVGSASSLLALLAIDENEARIELSEEGTRAKVSSRYADAPGHIAQPWEFAEFQWTGQKWTLSAFDFERYGMAAVLVDGSLSVMPGSNTLDGNSEATVRAAAEAEVRKAADIEESSAYWTSPENRRRMAAARKAAWVEAVVYQWRQSRKNHSHAHRDDPHSQKEQRKFSSLVEHAVTTFEADDIDETREDLEHLPFEEWSAMIGSFAEKNSDRTEKLLQRMAQLSSAEERRFTAVRYLIDNYEYSLEQVLPFLHNLDDESMTTLAAEFDFEHIVERALDEHVAAGGPSALDDLPTHKFVGVMIEDVVFELEDGDCIRATVQISVQVEVSITGDEEDYRENSLLGQATVVVRGENDASVEELTIDTTSYFQEDDEVDNEDEEDKADSDEGDSHN